MLKSIHFIALYVFLGAPAFWHLLWRPAVIKTGAVEGNVGAVVAKRVRTGLIFGFLLFAVSGLAEALMVGSWSWLTVVKLGLAAVAGHLWRLAGEQANRLLISGGTVLSGALLVVMGLISQGTGSSGLFAIVNHAVHLLASILWVGGLLYGAVLPWRGMGTDRTDAADDADNGGPAWRPLLAVLMERLSIVAFVGIAVVAMTGAYASYVHVYTPIALQQTTYGRTLAVKIAMFLFVTVVGLVNYLVVVPRLRRTGAAGERGEPRKPGVFGAGVSGVGFTVRVQAGLFIALLVATGALASLSSSNVIDELMHGVWELEMKGHSLNAEMSTGDGIGELQLDLRLTDRGGGPAPQNTRVVVDMEMPAHEMGLQPLEAERIGPGHYRVKPLLSMDGDWQALITATFPDGEEASASFEFEAFQGARSAGMTRRFDFRAAFFEFREERAARAATEGYVFDLGEYVRDFVFSLDPRPMYFVSGAFWFVAAIFVVAAGLQGAFPRWTAPLGLIALGIGTYFLFGATLVDAYPTTYVTNPVPFTADSVKRGRELYVANCSVCHGPDGHGDGPLAPHIDPPPEDLRVRHIDAHPDGELFWWFAYGIPGSEMPPTEASMTDEERWHVVNFVRSLHRELVDDDGAL